MAEMLIEPMREALENLSKNDFNKLKQKLNTESMNGKTIPLGELENASAVEVINLLRAYYYPDHVQVLVNALKAIPREDLAEKLSNKVKAEKKKSEDQIVESDGSPAKKQRLGGPTLYHGSYRLSDLEDYAANNQDQLIKQLEDSLEPNVMSKLKERLAHSKLKNSFVFTAKQCYTLYSNQDIKEFLKKISSARKSKNIPEKILNTLFSTIKCNNKTRAMDQKQSKDDSNSQLKHVLQERPLRENKPSTSSPAGSPPESEPKNQWKELPAKKGKGSAPVPPNASCLELNDRDGENRTPEPVCEKMDEDVLQPGDLPAHASEESQRYENKVSEAENSPHDRAIGKWYNWKKVKNCIFNCRGVREHEKYNCFVAEDVIKFKLPGDTEYGLLRILHDNDFTTAGKLKKNVAFELQFNMAVMGALRSEAISPVSDFPEVVTFDHSFAQFVEFFKDVVCKIVLPILALYMQVQVDRLQKIRDMQKYSINE